MSASHRLRIQNNSFASACRQPLPLIRSLTISRSAGPTCLPRTRPVAAWGSLAEKGPHTLEGNRAATIPNSCVFLNKTHHLPRFGSHTKKIRLCRILPPSLISPSYHANGMNDIILRIITKAQSSSSNHFPELTSPIPSLIPFRNFALLAFLSIVILSMTTTFSRSAKLRFADVRIM